MQVFAVSFLVFLVGLPCRNARNFQEFAFESFTFDTNSIQQNMPNNWFFFMDFDGRSPYIYDIEHCGTGNFVLREVFNCVSMFAGALFISFTTVSNCQRIAGNQQGSKPVKSSRSSKQVKRVTPFDQVRVLIDSRSREGATSLVNFGKFVSSTIRHLGKDAGQLSSIPMLSLVAALVPPFHKLGSAEVLALPLENSGVQVNKHMDQIPCLNEHRQCADFSFPKINWTGYAFEAKTGIKFPSALDNILAGENEYSLTSEVLVGTGSRSMRILRIKTLNVYAFGLYVHPDSICEKLGPKYASVPSSELNNQPEFFEDLLREDIHMTVRLVVSCNGLKINTVRDVFEKSLRTRLLKMNPDTDYRCVTKFGSYFTTDIALPAGTTIHFRQTADGQLITEIGGREIGTVHSKDLCRAFFDMYIGDVSVPSYAKEEITRNVASIIKRC